VYPWVFGIGWGLVVAIGLGDVLARVAGSRGVPWTALLGHMPLLGGILKANLLARWLDALRLGIDSGLDLPRAIALAAEATGEPALIRDAAAVSDQIARGLPLAGLATRRIPATVTAAMELVSTTGGGGELPRVLYSLGRMYEQRAEDRLRLLPSILTPLFLILIAGGVGLTVAAMFLPMVRLIQSLTGGF
jgi:type IV pilus assembly protein PilC